MIRNFDGSIIVDGLGFFPERRLDALYDALGMTQGWISPLIVELGRLSAFLRFARLAKDFLWIDSKGSSKFGGGLGPEA